LGRSVLVAVWVLLIPGNGQQAITDRAERLKQWVIVGEHESELECEIFRRRVVDVTASKADGGTASAFKLESA
jgi:hypothetical protein